MSEVKRYQCMVPSNELYRHSEETVVLASDYAALESQHAALKEKADRLAEALKDAKKTVEKRFLECGRQGANAHMTNPLRTEWEHCRATLHEIDAAYAAYAAHPAPPAKRDECPNEKGTV